VPGAGRVPVPGAGRVPVPGAGADAGELDAAAADDDDDDAAAARLAAWRAATLHGTVRQRLLLTAGSLLSGAADAAPAFESRAGALLASEPGALDGVFALGADATADSAARLELRDGRADGRFSLTVQQALRAPPPPHAAACDWAAVAATRRLFVLWGEEKAGFLALEPWLGAPDALNDAHCATLTQNQEAVWTWSVAVNRRES
jgi:hypothetical protein